MKNIYLSDPLVDRHKADYIISDILQMNLEDVTEGLNYQQCYQWSSVQHVELILALEKEFDAIIPAADVLKLNSVEKIRAWSYKHERNKKNNVQPNLLQEIKKDDSVNSNNNTPLIYRGLNEIYFDTTKITYINPEQGVIKYRGYDIEEILSNFSYEEFIFLMMNNKKPNNFELNDLYNDIICSRSLSPEVTEFVKKHASDSGIDVLRTAISLLGLTDTNYKLDLNKSIIKLFIQIQVIIGYHHCLQRGIDYAEPEENTGCIEYFLWLLKGKKPNGYEVDIFTTLFIYLADHGSTASTFAARIGVGTKTDLHSILTTAVSIFKGGAHGGVIENVLDMVDQIKHPENAHAYIQNKRKNHETIPGFGHRVHRTQDIRYMKFKELAKNICTKKNNMNDYYILEEVEAAMSALSDHGIIPNVDLYPGLVLREMGFSNSFSLTFYVAARMLGWFAHVTEQSLNNILIRPRLHYIGKNKN